LQVSATDIIDDDDDDDDIDNVALVVIHVHTLYSTLKPV